MSKSAIEARGLRKRYGPVAALDGFDLAVGAGTIHGLLGPNGAGKSTAVKIFTTLVDADAGTAVVDGHDVGRDSRTVRSRIGLVAQATAVDDILSGRQNLVLFGRLYGLSKAAAIARATELLDAFGLAAAADRPLAGYSGGMRRRLDIAAGLILRPAVLFLDEPTTGLDPRARNEVWRTVREVAEVGTTVLLTTQYLDEADQLAAVITVMNDGRVVAEGTPDRLKRSIGQDRVVITTASPDDHDRAHRALEPTSGAALVVDVDLRMITVESATGAAGLIEVVRALDAAGVVVDDIALRRPTLDEVFLTLTDTGPVGASGREGATA